MFDKLSLLEQGVNIAIVGIMVVFFALLFLFLFMKLFVLVSASKGSQRTVAVEVGGSTGKEPLTGEIVTAIALAIHRSREEFHDLEETIITLQRITKPYSPWSSKIHGLRRHLR